LPGPVIFYQWFSDYEYLASDYEQNLWSNATSVNIQTGYAFESYTPPFSWAVVDSRSRMMAILDYEGTEIDLGPVYHKLDLITKFTDMGFNKMGMGPRSGTVHSFIGWYGDRWFGITPDGRVDTLDFIPGYAYISPSYWLAIFGKNGIGIYDPSDKLRYELKNTNQISPYWDENYQGLFYLSEDNATIYYWRLGDPEPQQIASTQVDLKERAGFLIAPIINLKSLPYLRILPTRAAKPAEGTSIWSQTTYKELFQPGTNRYDVTIPADSSWRWSFSLGTTDPNLLEKILLPEDVEFRINGEWIDSNMFRMSDQTAEGRFSRAWATMLSGWRSGDKAELEILYTLHSAVTDGNVVYPPGEYRQIISLVVE
jgi:hypothetical protein